MAPPKSSFSRGLQDWLHWPRTKLARAALLCLALAPLKFIPERHFQFCGFLLQYAGLTLTLFVVLRWMSRKLLWRLRNRLVVTYLFVGLAPVVLLILLAAICSYVFAGQFATYLATAEINAAVDAEGQRNHLVALQYAHAISRNENPDVTFGGDASGLIHSEVFWKEKPAPTTWLQGGFRGIVIDNDKLEIRSVEIASINGAPLYVVSTQEIDSPEISALAHGMGELTLEPEKHFQLDDSSTIEEPRLDDNGQYSALHIIQGGALPPTLGALDHVVTFYSPVSVTNWQTGNSFFIPLRVTTRPSLLYDRLFPASVGGLVRMSLVILAIAFGVIEFLALVIAGRLTTTITYSVAELHQASQHVNQGDLAHRIPVTRDDQLAELEKSFNTMSSSLQKLLAEQKEKDRMDGELAIAQEVQAHFFPQSFRGLPSLEIYGICKPARMVSGDYFDFLNFGDSRLGLAVGDISGKGISAALLMATVHSAVRVYQFGHGIEVAHPLLDKIQQSDSATSHSLAPGMESPGEVLRLLNRHLYRTTQLEKYATLFLAVYDSENRRLTYSNGGHLPPIILGSNGKRQNLDAGGTVVGLFDDQVYEDRSVIMEPHDLLLAFSDGIVEPENEFGEFSLERILEIAQANRNMELPRIAERILAALSDWIGDNEQPDDCTLVLARVREE